MPKPDPTENPVYHSAKSSLEDHRSQSVGEDGRRIKITKKVIREVVSHHGPFLEKEEADAIVAKLSAVIK